MSEAVRDGAERVGESKNPAPLFGGSLEPGLCSTSSWSSIRLRSCACLCGRFSTNAGYTRGGCRRRPSSSFSAALFSWLWCCTTMETSFMKRTTIASCLLICRKGVPSCEASNERRLGYGEPLGGASARLPPGADARGAVESHVRTCYNSGMAAMANLVTAEDLLEPGHGCIYLTIGKPTSRRRAAKLQQMKLNEDFIFSYLQRVWGKLAPKEFLFGTSTPASVRGGSAIVDFHRGLSICDLPGGGGYGLLLLSSSTCRGPLLFRCCPSCRTGSGGRSFQHIFSFSAVILSKRPSQCKSALRSLCWKCLLEARERGLA